MTTSIAHLEGHIRNLHAQGRPAAEAAAAAVQKFGALPAAHLVASVHAVYTLTLVETAALLKKMGYALPDVVVGLAAVNPKPTALAITQAVHDPTIFPNATRAEVGAALTAAGYPSAEVSAALAAVFPATLRREGPAGNQTGTPFDDGAAALPLGSITSVLVRSGEILDGLQATYGATSLPLHGGLRGGPTQVPLTGNIRLTGISGYTGLWYGRNYVLQLTLHTSDGKTHGPYGSMTASSNRTAFSFQARPGEELVAFTGYFTQGLEADGSMTNYMTALGAVFKG